MLATRFAGSMHELDQETEGGQVGYILATRFAGSMQQVFFLNSIALSGYSHNINEESNSLNLFVRRKQSAMAIVSKPDQDNNVTLYDIPDAELEKYRIPTEKLAAMFPQKEDRSRSEAVAIAAAGSQEGDVQAYSGQDICYAWECDARGKCVYVWWYC